MFQKELFAHDLNFVGLSGFEFEQRVSAKIRYRTPEQPAQVLSLPDGRFRLRFKSAQKAITPGQSVVLYEGPQVLAGGIIEQPTLPASIQALQ